MQAPIVSIICLVVHDEFVVHKVEAVRLGLVGTIYHLLDWNNIEYQQTVDKVAKTVNGKPICRLKGTDLATFYFLIIKTCFLTNNSLFQNKFTNNSQLQEIFHCVLLHSINISIFCPQKSLKCTYLYASYISCTCLKTSVMAFI